MCVNDTAVPVTFETLPLYDPLNLFDEAPAIPEEIVVTLVHFQNTDMQWVHKCLKIQRTWWQPNQRNIPLLSEVLEIIKNNKSTKGAKRNLPRNPESLLSIELRGKILKFKNNPRVVILALEKDTATEDLLWFLEQLKGDLKAMKDAGPKDKSEQGEDPDPGASQSDEHDDGEQAAVPEDHMDSCVIETLDKILEHKNCQQAHFSHSRSCFRVKRKGSGTLEEFRVKDLKKKCTLATKNKDWSVVEHAFALAQQSSLRFLSEPENI